MNTEEINPHLTAKIVVSYVRRQRLGPDQLSDLITSVHRTIGQLGQPVNRRRFGPLRCRCAVPYTRIMRCALIAAIGARHSVATSALAMA